MTPAISPLAPKSFPELPAVGGVQLVCGKPVNETEYADDPVHPARTARLAELCDPALGEPALVDARDTDVELAALLERHRVVIVDEGWRSGGISAEISSRIVEQAFYELDAAPVRVCTAEVPLPYPSHLEQAALPNVDRIITATRGALESDDGP